MRFSRSLFIPCCLVWLIAACAAPERPNIIYIMVDDLGAADLSIYGRTTYKTPNLDALALEGMRFKHAYAAAPVCTPSRVAFMTGRYPARNPIGLREPLIMDSTDIHLGLSPEEPTVSSLLKEVGYHTALFGKWHLGFDTIFFPKKHGFDYFWGITPGGADYVTHRYEGKQVLYENTTPVVEEGYLTDLITNHAIEHLQKTSGPFFLSIQYTAPHWPWQAPGDPAYPDSTVMSFGGNAETFARMMQNLDQNIGRLMKALEDQGLKNNTLVIFTSDNGGERFSDMGAFKGKKLTLWEGGIRVPAFVRWPGKIKAPSETSQPVITMDWTATILDAARGSVPDAMQTDGISLLPILLEEKPVFDRNFYWRITNRSRWEAYRSGNLKYLSTPDGEGLYNLAIDPGEVNNIKDQDPQNFERLKNEFRQADKTMLPPYVFARKP